MRSNVRFARPEAQLTLVLTGASCAAAEAGRKPICDGIFAIAAEIASASVKDGAEFWFVFKVCSIQRLRKDRLQERCQENGAASVPKCDVGPRIVQHTH